VADTAANALRKILFPHFPLECGESDTSRTPVNSTAAPATTGNRKEQQIQILIGERAGGKN
jgi:hypothetical protein